MTKKTKKIEAEEKTEEPQEPKTYDNSGIKPGEVMNFDYVEDEKAKSELSEIVDALKSKISVKVKKSSNHDLVVLKDGKQILKVCPLKKRYSSAITSKDGSAIKNYSKATILKEIEKLE